MHALFIIKLPTLDWHVFDGSSVKITLLSINFTQIPMKYCMPMFSNYRNLKTCLLRAQERPATLILTVISGLRITRARHVYNWDS